MDQTFMKEKPILPLLLSMAAPDFVHASKFSLQHYRQYFRCADQ